MGKCEMFYKTKYLSDKSRLFYNGGDILKSRNNSEGQLIFNVRLKHRDVKKEFLLKLFLFLLKIVLLYLKFFCYWQC